MSFQSSSEYNKAPGGWSGQQYFMNPQPSVGRFNSEAPSFCVKGSSTGTAAIGVARSMAPQSNHGTLQDHSPEKSPIRSSSNVGIHGTPGAKLFNALPAKKNYAR